MSNLTLNSLREIKLSSCKALCRLFHVVGTDYKGVIVFFNVIQSLVLTCSHSSHMMVFVSSPTKMRSMKFIFTPSFPYAGGEERHSL